MMTNLDLLVLAFIVLSGVGTLSVISMFLAKNTMIKKICFYITIAFGLYACYVSLYMFWPEYLMQTMIGIILGVLSIAALVLERISKGNERKFLAARVMAAVAMVPGVANMFA